MVFHAREPVKYRNVANVSSGSKLSLRHVAIGDNLVKIGIPDHQLEITHFGHIRNLERGRSAIFTHRSLYSGDIVADAATGVETDPWTSVYERGV